MRFGRKLCLLALAVLLLLPHASFGEEGENAATKAENLSFSLQFDTTGHNGLSGKLLYDSISKPEAFSPYEQFSVLWKEEVPGHWLCIQWNVMPEGIRLIQYDRNDGFLSQTYVNGEYNTVLELDADTTKVTFAADRWGMEVARIALFSEGTLPEPFVPWQPTPDHLDYLIVSTHPDDDVIFMGGVIPIYGAEKGYVGTVAYVTTPSLLRVQEALLGVWSMGSTYQPLFLNYQDIADIERYVKAYKNRFLPESVTLSLVRLFRQHRPLVVFSHDVNGEYGHWQHIVVSASVLDAVRLAADGSYDPSSAEQYGTWQVQKCYLHLYEEDQLVMDVNTPLASMGGRTALEVAKDSFLRHVSQQGRGLRAHSDTDQYPLSHFGMAYGVVAAGEDVFDNVDPNLFYAALKAAPDPEPVTE